MVTSDVYQNTQQNQVQPKGVNEINNFQVPRSQAHRSTISTNPPTESDWTLKGIKENPSGQKIKQIEN